MKFVVAITLVAALFYASAEDKKEEERPKTFRRLIPADVLRDFPGVCFASTRCATIDVGQSWELAPFCGRSTCVSAEGNSEILLELVEDCGPLPKSNPKCKLSEKTNKTASFPDCCPIFECEEGAKLEYPEIPTVAPATAAEVEAAEKAAAAAAASSTTPKA
ncbi:uncharacterized protein LOC124409977 [Diprion similis]|uniref:uncharacterized protein LOC124409977 n=1 Tax=Diprion similis TaxID=362088 RepID=UPI001EF7B96B|nr:uncharacterized protein LOC124409977 [Diprion similis]